MFLYPLVKPLCYAVRDDEVVVQELVTVKNWGILSSDNLSSLRMRRNADIGSQPLTGLTHLIGSADSFAGTGLMCKHFCIPPFYGSSVIGAAIAPITVPIRLSMAYCSN